MHGTHTDLLLYFFFFFMWKQLVETDPRVKWGWMSHLSIPIPKSLDTCSDIFFFIVNSYEVSLIGATSH